MASREIILELINEIEPPVRSSLPSEYFIAYRRIVPNWKTFNVSVCVKDLLQAIHTRQARILNPEGYFRPVDIQKRPMSFKNWLRYVMICMTNTGLKLGVGMESINYV